jgi:predicted Zn-dependent protease
MVNRWPAIGELRFALAMVSLEAGMNEEAISVLSELHDRIPDNIPIQNLLLKAYEQALGSK